ncbi:unnamed protein product [Orchesella dallaii]|uniref:Odorant receptor n=1 Tax=Orchesella dallaii TaxID=48710 RepID=A0ABP1RQ81_9HEXA
MGVGEAFINVQLVYQRIFDMPWYYDKSEGKLILNRKLKTRQKMPFWHTIHLAVVLCLLFTIFRLKLIIRDYKVTRTVNPEELCFCGIVTAMTIQAAVTVYTMELEPKRLAYSVRETLNLGGVVYKGKPNSNRIPDMQELVSYGMAIALCNFVLITGLYPLLLNLDPINTILVGILPEVPRRLLAMFVYVITSFLAGSTCASFLLMVLTIVHIFDVQTAMNLKQSMGYSTVQNIQRVDRLLQNILKEVLSLLEKRNRLQIQPTISKSSCLKALDTEDRPVVIEIQKCGNEINFGRIYKKHMTMNLLMDMSNRNVEVYVPTMLTVGMTFCIIFNYSIVTLHTRKDMQILILAAIFILVAINGLIHFLCYHASLPLIHTTSTIMYWKGCLVAKLEKKQVRCMRPFGFKLGHFCYTKSDTALKMNDVIINATITLLLV